MERHRIRTDQDPTAELAELDQAMAARGLERVGEEDAYDEDGHILEWARDVVYDEPSSDIGASTLDPE